MKVIEFLEEVAAQTARLSGLELRTERSALSEAVYLKVRRQGQWYGIRLAAHAPVYACSRDCAQVLISPEQSDLEHFRPHALRVVAEVLIGGLVIADPDEVDQALLEARRMARNRTRRKGPRNTTWEWSEGNLAWRLVGVRTRKPIEGEDARYVECQPEGPPTVRLSAQEESDLRHRWNVRARWTHDEMLLLAERAVFEGYSEGALPASWPTGLSGKSADSASAFVSVLSGPCLEAGSRSTVMVFEWAIEKVFIAPSIAALKLS